MPVYLPAVNIPAIRQHLIKTLNIYGCRREQLLCAEFNVFIGCLQF